jgi:uncharacterized protein YdhG (YjbR/CyaY superfamily)
MKGKIAASVEEYIAAFPKEVQPLLNQMRKTIKTAAPKAEEIISYGMPGYKYLSKHLVYFAGYKNHIGFYATPTGHSAFKKELAKYKQGKGSVQFPIDEKLPLQLVQRIVKFRVAENDAKAADKKIAAPAKTNTTTKPVPAGAVGVYMNKLVHPLKAEAEILRTVIKKAGKQLQERIKWNAPSYHVNETDLFTFNFSDVKFIRIVFHHASVVKIKSPLLTGEYKDRRIVYLKNAKEAVAAKKEIANIIKAQLKLINSK